VADPSAPEGDEVRGRIVAPSEAPSTPMLYANHVQLTYTPEDFTLHLGWYSVPVIAAPPEGEVTIQVRPVARVSLPLNLVRSIAAVFVKQMEAWEASFGTTLPMHPNPPPFVDEVFASLSTDVEGSPE
jgi:hypothetical protein